MLQKVIKIGNSIGITLPKKFVTQNKIKPGNQISLTQTNGGLTLTTRLPKETSYQQIPDQQFQELIKEVETRYGPALDELAHLP